MNMKQSKESDGSREPLVHKDTAESKPEQPWMVYLSTFVAVCGSFAFGSCVSEVYDPWEVNTFVRPLPNCFYKNASLMNVLVFDAGGILLACSGCN